MKKKVKIRIDAIVDDEKPAGKMAEEVKEFATELKEEIAVMHDEDKDKEGLYDIEVTVEEELL